MPILFALFIALWIAGYVGVAPDRHTLRGSRGLLAAGRAGVRASRSTWSGKSPKTKSAPRGSGGSGGRTARKTAIATGGTASPNGHGSSNGGSNGKSSGGGSKAHAGWVLRTGRNIRRGWRATRSGWTAARQAYGPAAAAAQERRDARMHKGLATYRRLSGLPDPETPSTVGGFHAGHIAQVRWKNTRLRVKRAFTETPIADTDPVPDTTDQEAPPVSTTAPEALHVDDVGEFLNPQMQKDKLEEIRIAVEAFRDARDHLDETIFAYAEAYTNAKYKTSGVTATTKTLIETFDEGHLVPDAFLEQVPHADEALDEAISLGEHAAEHEAEGDVEAFQDA